VATGGDLCRDEPGPAVYCAHGASISPDGSQVIYDAPSEDTWRSAIYVVDTQGGTPRLLLSGGRRFYPVAGRSILSWLSNPAYSPGGDEIAYFDHQLDGPSQLRVMNADGTGVRVVLDGTGYHVSTLTWSPDGERLAWAGSDGIYVVDADGSGLTLAIPGGADPSWSPDGARIAYSIGFPRLTVAAPDGTHVQQFWYGEPGPWNPLFQPGPDVG
jgi:Tol biopolymer transport system component